MPKLRKMLGRADMPVCLALMRLLDTQSRRTVAGWAIRITSEVCLPVYEAHSPEGPDLRADVQDCARCAAEGGRPAAVKPQLRALAQIARAEKDPVAQAAARAIATACAVLQTPTGALGCLFYAAAAETYHTLGTSQPAAVYDQAAEKFFERALADLQDHAVPDEPDPIRVNWNC